MFCEYVVTLVIITIFFTIVKILVSYKSNKKMRNPQHFHINFFLKIIGKLLLMDKQLILVGPF